MEIRREIIGIGFVLLNLGGSKPLEHMKYKGY